MIYVYIYEIGNKVAVIEGQRTPFVLSSGVFEDHMAVDLGRFAIKGKSFLILSSFNSIE